MQSATMPGETGFYILFPPPKGTCCTGGNYRVYSWSATSSLRKRLATESTFNQCFKIMRWRQECQGLCFLPFHLLCQLSSCLKSFLSQVQYKQIKLIVYLLFIFPIPFFPHSKQLVFQMVMPSLVHWCSAGDGTEKMFFFPLHVYYDVISILSTGHYISFCSL